MPKKANAIKKIQNSLIVGLVVEIIEENNSIIAYCPALELSSYGKDLEIAKKRFEKEVEIFFIETARKGTLEKYLLKLGWTLKSKPIPQYIPPVNINQLIMGTNSFMENVAIPVC